MNNYTEHTWVLVTINEAIKELMKTYVKYPPRKLQSEVYTGPITITEYSASSSCGTSSRRRVSPYRCRRATRGARADEARRMRSAWKVTVIGPAPATPQGNNEGMLWSNGDVMAVAVPCPPEPGNRALAVRRALVHPRLPDPAMGSHRAAVIDVRGRRCLLPGQSSAGGRVSYLHWTHAASDDQGDRYERRNAGEGKAPAARRCRE